MRRRIGRIDVSISCRGSFGDTWYSLGCLDARFDTRGFAVNLTPAALQFHDISATLTLRVPDGCLSHAALTYIDVITVNVQIRESTDGNIGKNGATLQFGAGCRSGVTTSVLELRRDYGEEAYEWIAVVT
jgi:hypothetical protein